VVVTLVAQVDPSPYAGRPEALLRALRATAARTQPPVVRLMRVPVRRFWVINALAGTLKPAVVRRLAAHPAVATVDLDRLISLTGTETLLGSPPDGLGPVQAAGALPGATVAAAPAPGPLDAINARAAWTSWGVTGVGVRIGSIDTGVDTSTPDLAGKIAAFKNFAGTRQDPYDDSGHGTHSIGTMVGGSASGKPIGVAPGAQVVVAKALDSGGRAEGSALLAAAQWITDPDGNPATPDFPTVVNNSWTGGGTNDTWFRRTVRVWAGLGIAPIFAAGNAGPAAGTISSPGSYPESFSVSAVDDLGVLADFSSRGPVVWEDRDKTGPPAGTVLLKADVAAPGVSIVSSVGSGYDAFSGTSMAAPHVSGVVALVKQAVPSLTGAQILEIIRNTARDLGPAGPDPGYGTGRVDALAAVSAAKGAPPPAPPPAAPPPAIAATPQALRDVRASPSAVRRGRTLVVVGRLAVQARLRVTLVSSRPRAAASRGRVAVALVRRPQGAFRLRLPLRSPPGRYVLELRAETSARVPIGPQVRVRVRITPPPRRRR
jgi:subtilisin family serine protease